MSADVRFGQYVNISVADMLQMLAHASPAITNAVPATCMLIEPVMQHANYGCVSNVCIICAQGIFFMWSSHVTLNATARCDAVYGVVMIVRHGVAWCDVGHTYRHVR